MDMYVDGNQNHLSIYRAVRSIKRRDNNLYNALRSIYEDSIFVGEIAQLWPNLPLLANLRCGLWYFPKFHSTCYFKSTDGHTNNLSFNTSRLNLHVAQMASDTGGCIIVDSTRRGKRFPDSMSKTIPMWSCVLNRSIANYLKKTGDSGDWDCELHLPLTVPVNERRMIEERLEGWTRELESSGVDISSLALRLKKPLRPLWISPRSVIWINEVPDSDSWDFTPIMLVSASSCSGSDLLSRSSMTEFSWNYIAGAGDDEESWARGLTPENFWNHAHDVISSGPDLCNQKIADIVEKDRVYRARRGQKAPQVKVKTSKVLDGETKVNDLVAFDVCNGDSTNMKDVFWLGSSNVAVGMAQLAERTPKVDCILNCDKEHLSVHPDSSAYLQLPIVNSKLNRSSLLSNLPAAVNFAEVNLRKGNRLLVCCSNGEDISVCVCLAILTSLFNDEGTFDDGKTFRETHITKSEMRRRLIFICKFAASARPSRGNLRQVFAFLTRGREASAKIIRW